MKYRTLFFLAVLAGLSFHNLDAEVKSPVSDGIFLKIRNVFKAFRKEGYDFYSEKTINKIYKNIEKFATLEPLERLQNKTVRELTELGKVAVDKKFPYSVEQYRAVAEKKGEKKYAAAKPNTTITVFYKKGDNKTYQITGIYYSHRRNSVKIGLKNLSLIDLLPESRAQFDKYYCERKKKEYVDKEVLRYLEEKGNYTITVVKKLHKEQQEHNEDAGYIYVWHEWRTAKSVADILLKKYQSESKPLIKKPDKGIKVAGKNGNGGKKSTDDTEKVGREDPQKEKYEKLKKQAEEALKKILSRYAGIDAEQGYKLAIWGMPRDVVNILLKDEFGGNDSVSRPAGPIQKIELSYYKGYFQKVKVTFRVLTPQAMLKVVSRLHETFGKTDEEKAEDAKSPEQKAAEEKLRKEKEEKAKETKRKGKKGPPPPTFDPVKIVKWTGKITHAYLYIRVNSAQTAYEEVYLVKESPALIGRVDREMQRRKLVEQNSEIKKNMKDFDKKIQRIDF